MEQRPTDAVSAERGSQGTGVYFPPNLKALARSRANTPVSRPSSTAEAAASTPVGTPTACSSRSTSFTSSTGGDGGGNMAAVVPGKPPQHVSANQRCHHNRPQISTARRSPFGADTVQEQQMSDVMRTATTCYGRHSLDCTLSGHMARGPQPVLQLHDLTLQPDNRGDALFDSAWPAAAAMCNSLSMPPTSTPLARLAVQDSQSWGSTVDGDAFLVPPAPDTCVAITPNAPAPGNSMLFTNNQHLQLARQQEQARQQLLMQQAQTQQQQQLLLHSMAGSGPAAHSIAARRASMHVLPVAAAQQNTGASADRAAVARRASLQALPVAAPSQSPGLMTHGVAASRASLHRLPVPASVPGMDQRTPSSPLPDMVSSALAGVRFDSVPPAPAAAANGIDNLDAALEAELDAALQKLLAMREEITRKRVAADVASTLDHASCGTALPLSPTPTPEASGDMLAASGVAAGLYPPTPDVASILMSQLYQPSPAPVAAVGSCNTMSSAYDPSAAALGHDAASCGSVSLGALSLADISGNTAARSLTPAVAALPAAADAQPLSASRGLVRHNSLGQAGAGAETLADWLTRTTGAPVLDSSMAGLTPPEVVLQEELQRLALREAELSALRASQNGQFYSTGALVLPATGPQLSYGLQAL